MKQGFKRIVSMALIASMIATMAPSTAWAASVDNTDAAQVEAQNQQQKLKRLKFRQRQNLQRQEKQKLRLRQKKQKFRQRQKKQRHRFIQLVISTLISRGPMQLLQNS